MFGPYLVAVVRTVGTYGLQARQNTRISIMSLELNKYCIRK